MEEGKRVVESNGRTGYTARLWKVVYIDGKETKRTQVNSSSYMSTPSVVRVGTKKKEVPKPTTETGKKTTKAEDKAKLLVNFKSLSVPEIAASADKGT